MLLFPLVHLYYAFRSSLVKYIWRYEKPPGHTANYPLSWPDQQTIYIEHLNRSSTHGTHGTNGTNSTGQLIHRTVSSCDRPSGHPGGGRPLLSGYTVPLHNTSSFTILHSMHQPLSLEIDPAHLWHSRYFRWTHLQLIFQKSVGESKVGFPAVHPAGRQSSTNSLSSGRTEKKVSRVDGGVEWGIYAYHVLS